MSQAVEGVHVQGSHSLEGLIAYLRRYRELPLENDTTLAKVTNCFRSPFNRDTEILVSVEPENQEPFVAKLICGEVAIPGHAGEYHWTFLRDKQLDQV